MKVAVILWNIVLAVVAAAGLALVVPRVYEQARFQFTDPRGGSFMWPATFEGFLVVAAFLASVVALSYAFNRKLGLASRAVAAFLVVVLLVCWVMGAILWSRAEIPGGFQQSVVSGMVNFDGALFMLIAIVSLGIAATAGRGPLSMLAEFLRRRTGKQNDAV